MEHLRLEERSVGLAVLENERGPYSPGERKWESHRTGMLKKILEKVVRLCSLKEKGDGTLQSYSLIVSK
jgi:hypothetical protein